MNELDTDPDELESFLQSLKQMRENKVLDDNAYYQCLVSLAHQFLVKHHNVDRALVLLNMCPPEYFKGAFKEQCRTDSQFAAASFSLTYTLIHMGLAGIEVEEPTQAPGEA